MTARHTWASLRTRWHLANAKSGRVSAVKGTLPLSRRQAVPNAPYRTFRDKTEDDDIMNTLGEIAEELGKDLEKLQYAGKTITLKLKLSL